MGTLWTIISSLPPQLTFCFDSCSSFLIQGAPCPLVRLLYKVEVDAIEYAGAETGPLDLSEDLIEAVRADAQANSGYQPIGGEIAEAMKKEEMKKGEGQYEIKVETPRDLTDLLINKVNPKWLFRK